MLKRNLLIVLACITINICCPAFVFPQSPLPELRLGIIPEQNIFKQNQKYSALAHYMSGKAGVKVSITVLPDYGSVLYDMKSGLIDGAFFGSLSGAIAHERLEAEAVARPITNEGKASYHGHIFVRKDSGITNVKGMRGKTLVLIEKGSSCGYLYPLAYFRMNGVTDLQTFFKNYYFAGSHDAAINAVLNSRADVGVAKSTVYYSMRAANPRIEKELLILDESQEFPSHGLFLKKSVNPSIRNAVTKALFEMHGDPEGRSVLKAMEIAGYVSANVQNDYQNVFDLAKKAGINLKTYNLKK